METKNQQRYQEAMRYAEWNATMATTTLHFGASCTPGTSAASRACKEAEGYLREAKSALLDAQVFLDVEEDEVDDHAAS